MEAQGRDTTTLPQDDTRDEPIEQDSRLLDLPDEILHSILNFLDVHSLLASQRTCRQLFALDNPLLWRQYCLSIYQYWHPLHNFDNLLQQPAARPAWRTLFARRSGTDRDILRAMERIIHYVPARLLMLQSVAAEGEDAKDVLYSMLSRSENTLDVLARKYWINEVLGSIERGIALQEWDKLSKGEDVPLERALGAFDLFVCEKPPETLDQISAHLDMLARQFETEISDQPTMCTRARAFALVRWLRSRGFRGVEEDSYYKLQNSLISVALCDSRHRSIPIISVAIFCCVGQRLGLDIKPCGFPGRVLAIIGAPRGQDLDGESHSGTDIQLMYLDPWEDVEEIPISRLRSQLSNMGANPAQQTELLKPSTTAEMVYRASRNIEALPHHDAAAARSSFSTVLSSVAPEALAFHGLSSSETSGLCTTVYRSRSGYAAGWAQLFTAPGRRDTRAFLTERLDHLFRSFEPDWRIDLPLLKRYIAPLFPPQEGIAIEQTGDYFIRSYARDVLQEDSLVPAKSARNGNAEAEKVRYRVGQVFHHRRYMYIGAVIGWDPECRASENWMAQMNVDGLSQGRSQCFYHVVVDDESVRYVAEENIELLFTNANGGYVDAPVELPLGLSKIAVKWFKRWDRNRGRFESNVQEQYPDD